MPQFSSHALSRLAALAVLPAALAGPPVASASLQGTMGVTGGSGAFMTNGIGAPTAPLGDVDGDRLADVLLYSADADGAFTGRALFGQRGSANVDLGTPSSRLIALPSDVRVSRAGDVNGDGTDDVLLTFGLSGDDPADVRQAVIFGGPGIRTIRPEQLASRGFAVTGGVVEAPVGDVNGDGRDDLFARRLDANNETTDDALLLWGRTSRTTVNLANPGSAALNLGAVTQSGYSGPTGADVNGDRIDDLVVSRSEDSASVIFGRQSWAPVSIANPGERGYVITGVEGQITPAGDVTGDGRQDLAVPYFGGTSIVPGQSTTGTVDRGSNGITLNGATATDPGNAVVPVGDVTGDGRDDLVVTAANRVRLVAGRAAPGSVDVQSAPAIPGLPFGNLALAPVGDVDGDQRPDVLASSGSALEGRATGKNGLATLITHGRDIFAPQFITHPVLPAGGVSLTPTRFRVGPNATTLAVAVSEDAVLHSVLRDASGRYVATTWTRVGTPYQEGMWDGRVNGRALRPGDYRSTVTPIDASGNRGPSRTVAFTILP